MVKEVIREEKLLPVVGSLLVALTHDHMLNNLLQSWNYTDIDFLARTNKYVCHPSVSDLQDEKKKNNRGQKVW